MFYLHIGKNVSVRKAEIVGIFDIETATQSRDTINFLKAAQEGMRVVNLANDLPKTFVLTDNEWKEEIFITMHNVEGGVWSLKSGVFNA